MRVQRDCEGPMPCAGLSSPHANSRAVVFRRCTRSCRGFPALETRVFRSGKPERLHVVGADFPRIHAKTNTFAAPAGRFVASDGPSGGVAQDVLTADGE